MLKKTVSVLLAFILCLGVSGAVFAEETDISSHWSKDAFLRLEEMNIINGYDDGTYRPDATIKRSEFFKILNMAANVTRNEGSYFSDVAENAWYKTVVDKAYTAKYASGYGDMTFRPEANMTRAEAAAAICKAFGGDVEEEKTFADQSEIPAWAERYISILSSSGMLSGYEDGSFRAGRQITRAETVSIFNRFIGARCNTSVNHEDETFDEKVIVGVTDIIFTNCVFEDDIYIGPGVNGGEIRFINCEIKGNIYCAARGGAGIVLENSDANKLCANSTDLQTVVLTGSTVVSNVVLRSPAKLMEMNTDKGAELVTAYATAELSGDFEEVTVAGGSGINLTSGSIKKLNVTAPGSPRIDAVGTIETVNAETECVVNGNKITAGEEAEDVKGNSGVHYSYTLAMLNGEIPIEDSSVGGSRTDIRDDDNCVLTGITLSSGVLSPSFSPDVTDYKAFVSNEADKVTVNPLTDGTVEVKVKGKTVGEKGYEMEISNSTESVTFDLYSELAKKKSYTVEVTGYGTDDTALADVSANKPATVTKSGNNFTVKLTGSIDYSSGQIPVTLTMIPVNSKSGVEIDGVSARTKDFDLYDSTKQTAEVKVTSEDGSGSETYLVTLERNKIPAIDSADSATVDKLIANPSEMTMDDLSKARVGGGVSGKLDKYKSYLARIAHNADGADTDGKQAVIQKAIDVVNEYDGKLIRIEAEEHYINGFSGAVKTFTETSGEEAQVLNLAATVKFSLELPEGDYKISARTCAIYNKDQTYSMTINGESKYAVPQGGKCFAAANFSSSTFGIRSQVVSIDGGVTAFESARVDNFFIDYVEFEMQF